MPESHFSDRASTHRPAARYPESASTSRACVRCALGDFKNFTSATQAGIPMRYGATSSRRLREVQKSSRPRLILLVDDQECLMASPIREEHADTLVRDFSTG